MPYNGRRSTIKFLLAFVLGVSSVGGVQAQAYLPLIGGEGGGMFVAGCAPNEFLAGMELRAADDVDAIRPICISEGGPAGVAYSSANASALWHGGSGGRQTDVKCPPRLPVVIAIRLVVEGADTRIIDSIDLFCGELKTRQQTPPEYPSAVFAGSHYQDGGELFGLGITRTFGNARAEEQSCPSGQVAIGFHGRSGVWVDALGLICAAPQIAPDNAVKYIGRVNKGSVAPRTPGSICDSARDARSRNSPVAPKLEAACRVFLARPQPAVPAPTMTDALKVDDAARRVELALEADTMLQRLRDRVAEGERQGFDLGLASSEGQSQWGPNKQKIYDGLDAAAQRGFRTSVGFVLDRNRNQKLATTGASITAADAALTQSRTRDPDPRYWLGFDIATGIFGDAALGADGNTQTGPGSLGIRDALSPISQRGFDAAVAVLVQRH